MPPTTDLDRVAEDLLNSVSTFVRRIRQQRVDGGLSLPQRRALSRLSQCGPTTASELARLEQMSAQSMGATLARLEDQQLIARTADPRDGRRVSLSITDAGQRLLRQRRSAHTEQLVTALSTGFTNEELRQLTAAAPLIERLANSL